MPSRPIEERRCPARQGLRRLASVRAAVDSKDGYELDRLLNSYRGQRFAVGGSVLKSAPRGFAKDHRLVHLLRHKGVYEWLDRHVGPTTRAPTGW